MWTQTRSGPRAQASLSAPVEFYSAHRTGAHPTVAPSKLRTIVQQVRSLDTSRLKRELETAGADADTVRIADIEETAVSYMADESTRIRVKMVGDLTFGSTEGKA